MQYLLTQEELDNIRTKYAEEVKTLKIRLATTLQKSLGDYGTAFQFDKEFHPREFALFSAFKNALADCELGKPVI